MSGHSESKRRSSIASSSSVRTWPGPDLTVSVARPARRRTRTSTPSGGDRQVALLDALPAGARRGRRAARRRGTCARSRRRGVSALHADGTLRRVPPTPTELLLPPALDRAATVALLAKRLELHVGRAHTRGPGPARQLRPPPAGGRPAGRAAGRAPRRAAAHRPRAGRAGAARRRRAARRATWRASCRRGRCASGSRGVLEERALLPVVRVRSAVRAGGGAQRRRQDRGAARDRARRGGPGLDSGSRSPRGSSCSRCSATTTSYERTLRVLRDRLGLEPARARRLRRGGRRPSAGARTACSSKPRGRARPRHARRRRRRGWCSRGWPTIAEANVAGHARRPRHRVPARPARLGPARALGAARAQAACTTPASARHLRTELKWVQALTGPVRDLDVQLLEWDELVAPLASERAADLEPLRGLLQRRRAARARASCGAACAASASRRRWPPGARSRRPRPPTDASDRMRGAADRGARGRPDPQGLPPDGPRRLGDRRRQPGRGAARPAQARQGAALPARAVRRPVRRPRSSSRWSRRSRTSRTCSATSRTARCEVEMLRGARRRPGRRARRPRRADRPRPRARRAARRPARRARALRRAASRRSPRRSSRRSCASTFPKRARG